ncbi:polymeric immunoglobulin receptor-like isoform X2 [Narcine bancroftii]|uniref:polymeric immunoglobulin receptor-like isoform X2 n=1 Tax=Narcine bancroftii TaxID=1343680 RepID=UPI0038313A94
MDVLCVWIAAVPLLVPVSAKAITVSAVEGGSAVLPCTFTHIPVYPYHIFNTLWYRSDLQGQNLIANCTNSDPDYSLCDKAAWKAGERRIQFVGNLSQTDASIMMEGLRQEDNAQYVCSVHDLTGVQWWKIIKLIVKATGEPRSVVTGTKGASVILPCLFTLPHDIDTRTVTWMKKNPYHHIITFRLKSNGSWVAEDGATRYDLLGDPKQGNASTRVNQLSVQDSHSYLCLVESLRSQPNLQYLSQREVQLLVTAVFPPITMLWFYLPLGLKALALFVMWIVLCSDRRRKEEDRSITGS